MTIQTPHADRAADFVFCWQVIAQTEREFCGDWPPDPVPEFKFDGQRKWRFDWAWPSARVAVEVDGGRWRAGGGRHGSDPDRVKLNTATAQGWRILHFSPKQLEDDPTTCVNIVVAALRWKE